MTYKVCSNCGQEARAITRPKCSKCGKSEFQYVNEESAAAGQGAALSPSAVDGNYLSSRTKGNKEKHARIAVQSAKIVNVYGTYIQVLGIILGFFVACFGVWLASKLNNFGYAIGGILVGVLDIAIFAVQGALFRMISNYIIAKLED